MKHFYFALLLSAVLFSAATPAFAQDTSTQGTEFWVSFMSNGHKHHTAAPNNGNWILTQLLISAKRDCSGTINNPQTGWSTSFTVNANSITTIDIPEGEAYIDGTSEQVLNKGLQVISDDTVSVFCTNIAYLSFDASFVLPTQSLSDDYIIQTYNQSNVSSNFPYQKENQTSAFLIVATENGTTIDITPTTATLGGHPAGRPFTITLDKGQVYQVRSNKDDNERDLSGSRVTARNGRLIAVFNGNTLTSVPTNGSSFDHIFEQAMPLQSWGRSFVVTSSLEREKDYVKVTSASDNNRVFRNGELIATLQANESYIFELSNNQKSCFIETDAPAAVYLYNTTRGGNSIGDPSVVWIAPIEQRIDDITFSTFNNELIEIENHHVNVIVNSSDINRVYLDGDRIPASEFSAVNGTDQYSFARLTIRHGVHRLTCSNGFNAHVYGFGIAKGYAYLVGSRTIDLSTKVYMNGTAVAREETYEYCPDAPITFEAEVNNSNASILWDFGDGTTSRENPVDHVYVEKRIYEVVLTAVAKGSRSNDVSHYFVDTRTHTFIEQAELCRGDVYTEHGFNVTIANDTILETEIDNTLHPICKDSLLIYVTALDGFYASYSDTLCWRGDPFQYTEYGFDFLVDHPDTYTQHVTNPIPGGCDSIVDLTLIVTDRIISPNPIEYSDCAASFTWNGVTYTESGDYEQVLVSSMGCDSIVELHIFLDETLEGGTDTVTGQCHPYEWHGQIYDQTGFYTTTIPSLYGCDSIVHLDLSINMAADPSEIHPMDTLNDAPHWVISATEYEIHYYEFNVWDNNPDMVWDSVQWSLEGQSHWQLQPFGEGNSCCRVVVLDRVEDTVWLTAHIYDPCHPGESVERRYWLLCSFYGIDENDLPAFSCDIVPNPNNGQMDIVTSRLEGAVEVKVYDMTGLMVDQFTILATPENRHHYSLSNYHSGIYIMLFNNNGKQLVKTFVVTK